MNRNDITALALSSAAMVAELMLLPLLASAQWPYMWDYDAVLFLATPVFLACGFAFFKAMRHWVRVYAGVTLVISGMALIVMIGSAFRMYENF